MLKKEPVCLSRCARRGHLAAPLLLALVLFLRALPTAAEPTSRFYVDLFTGVMTENRYHDVFLPSKLDLADSGLLGVGIAWERQIASSRFHFGAQLQAVAHAGRQDHFEFNLPLIIRYVPRNPVPRWLKSTSFGLGLSHATKIPQVELDRTGDSQRNFFYWLAEIEVSTANPNTDMFFRLHHRSDGYGYFEADGGSTALSFGWRMPF